MQADPGALNGSHILVFYCTIQLCNRTLWCFRQIPNVTQGWLQVMLRGESLPATTALKGLSSILQLGRGIGTDYGYLPTLAIAGLPFTA